MAPVIDGRLRRAQQPPERFGHLMVKVAGYSARFVDLPPHEQVELMSRTTHCEPPSGLPNAFLRGLRPHPLGEPAPPAPHFARR